MKPKVLTELSLVNIDGVCRLVKSRADERLVSSIR